MRKKVVIVAKGATSFTRYLKEFGVDVYTVGEHPSDMQGAMLSECEAIYWDMATLVNPRTCHLVRSLLLSVPRTCERILDFNLKEPDAERLHLIKLSLKCCDLLKIDSREFVMVCNLLGLTSPHSFDNGFELMAHYHIKTLILTYGTRGCHVFHGSAVSEKWGMTTNVSHQSEEAESAFLAAFFVASQEPNRLFTECHRIAFDYMCQQNEKDFKVY